MFELDMTSIRQAASDQRLMANLAKTVQTGEDKDSQTPQISRKGRGISHETPGLARLAISHAVSHESANLLDARLIAAAMRVSDMYSDSEQAREDMRADCLNTPLHLRVDLLNHFDDLQKLHSLPAGYQPGFQVGFHQKAG